MSITIERRMRRCGLVCLLVILMPLSGVGGAQTVRPASPSPNSTDNDAEASRNAASEPSSFADDHAAAALAAVAVMDPDPQVREEAVRSLRGRSAESDLPVLQQALLDVAPRVRAAAIDTLADIGGDDAISALAVALNDANATLREEVVYALGKIGGPTARVVLQQALGDQQESVREAAGAILAELDAAGRRLSAPPDRPCERAKASKDSFGPAPLTVERRAPGARNRDPGVKGRACR
jgi:hypothetical protein